MKLISTYLAGLLLVMPLTATAESTVFDTLLSGLSERSSVAEILPVEEAFQLSSEVSDAQVTLVWDIADGYYLYRDKFAFTLDNAAIEIAEVSLPAGVLKNDPEFGSVMVNYQNATATLMLARPGAAMEAMLHVRYQGCKENSVCYPPVDKYLPMSLVATTSDSDFVQVPPAGSASGQRSEQDRVTSSLLRDGLWRNVLVFLGFGLLLAFTPCVLPMIPILSGIIVGQGAELTVARAFSLSLTYVLAMAFTYAVLGVIAGSLALNLAVTAQNVWAIAAFSAVFVALALSMFGVYELRLPNRFQSWLARFGKRGGSLSGVAVMGGVSAIVVAPCITPPLAGALLYISQTGNATLGGMVLFAMGLGMGVPLLIFGASAGKLLPKTGKWMESVKHFFGVLMLAVAIWFIERVVSPPVALLLWATLLIVTAVKMGALSPATGWQGVWRGFGVVMLIYGIVLVVGAASGGGDVLRPLAKLTARHNAEDSSSVAFRPVADIAALEAMVQQATASGRPVMLDFYADWCITCKEMERHTFPEVRQLLDSYVLLKADVTDNDAMDQALLMRFNIFGPPAMLFFGRDGVEMSAYRVVGFMDAARFRAHLQAVLAAYDA